MVKLNHEKILVTGADGFIGSHLTEEMAGQGYKVRGIQPSNLNCDHKEHH